MELQQMRYVLAVAETGSFMRAAERCFVTESALTRQIAGLERELGFPLFDRTTRRVQLTDAGHAFIPAATESVSAAQNAILDAARAVGHVPGDLVIGAVHTVTSVDMPLVLQRFTAAHPEVEKSLHGGTTEDLTAQVRAGATDVAFIALTEEEEPQGVSARVLAHEPLVALVPPEHGLADQDRVELENLAGEFFVDKPAGTPSRIQSDQAFARAGVKRNVAFEVGAVDDLTELVREGLAVAMVPEAFSRDVTGLAKLRVEGSPLRVEYLIWSDHSPSLAATAFLGILQERVRR